MLAAEVMASHVPCQRVRIRWTVLSHQWMRYRRSLTGRVFCSRDSSNLLAVRNEQPWWEGPPCSPEDCPLLSTVVFVVLRARVREVARPDLWDEVRGAECPAASRNDNLPARPWPQLGRVGSSWQLDAASFKVCARVSCLEKEMLWGAR
jgi:hypothetical protein